MNNITIRRSLPTLRLLYQARTASHWNKDWKPGPYPETPEQRKAAAKKYNLLPEEYEPHDNKTGILEPDDYPKLPEISVENKDIFYPWDLPDERRNFGEPIHNHGIYFGEERSDSHVRQKFKYTPLQMFLGTFSACLFLFLVCCDPIPFFPPVAARQFPKQGVVHYSYEPLD